MVARAILGVLQLSWGTLVSLPGVTEFCLFPPVSVSPVTRVGQSGNDSPEPKGVEGKLDVSSSKTTLKFSQWLGSLQVKIIGRERHGI